MAKLYPELKSSAIIKKHENNPILTADNVEYEAGLIFNAGVIKYHGKYVMLFRDDYGVTEEEYGKKFFEGTHIGIAFSDDGINWKAEKKPIVSHGDVEDGERERIYDPRLTVIEDEVYICYAVDTRHGIRGGIGKVKDFEKIEEISLSVPDNRNMVLFPEKINGMYTRLERPFPVYGNGGRDKFDIWCSQSPDLKFWGNSNLVLGVENVPFANDKIGPAAPPVKTEKGWLTIFHAVDIDDTRGKNGWAESWIKRYTAGIMLLDLNDPSKVIGMCKKPLIAPEEVYETDIGFRQNVIFPGGMILEDDGEVKIYYGASDTVECLATANVDDLLKLCIDNK